MKNLLTIVMYHYVRDLQHSRYPKIKGLATKDFKQQIRYIKKHYNVISGEKLMDVIVEGDELPPHPAILTFDDGYIDHFTQVFPILDSENLRGCFFPSDKCIIEHQVLDVNKVHFILASVPEKQKIVDYIVKCVDENKSHYGLLPASTYIENVAKSNRLDTAQVVFCKSMLQRELPIELRQIIIDELFRKYVTGDEASFSYELYMSAEQIQMLQRHGMYVGSHGYEHFWMNAISSERQEKEIDRSLLFLESIGADVSRWIMSYPYGAYNESLLSILKSRNCIAGMTIEVNLASLDDNDVLTLPRLDTIDLPKDVNAEDNKWTIKAKA